MTTPNRIVEQILTEGTDEIMLLESALDTDKITYHTFRDSVFKVLEDTTAKLIKLALASVPK